MIVAGYSFDLDEYMQGSITSVPQDPRTAIPIQIVCSNVELCDQKYCNMQEFKTIWKHVLRVAELAKSNPSGITRYQRNLELLIQEVLKSNRHLFTDNEVSLLGTLLVTCFFDEI